MIRINVSVLYPKSNLYVNFIYCNFKSLIILKFISIANQFWQVVSQIVACPAKLIFSMLSFFLCSLEVKVYQRGQTWAAELPSLTLLHIKVSRRTLRSPTLHLRWRIKETHYALKKLIPEDGCQPVMILPWLCEEVLLSFLRKVMPLDLLFTSQ